MSLSGFPSANIKWEKKTIRGDCEEVIVAEIISSILNWKLISFRNQFLANACVSAHSRIVRFLLVSCRPDNFIARSNQICSVLSSNPNRTEILLQTSISFRSLSVSLTLSLSPRLSLTSSLSLYVCMSLYLYLFPPLSLSPSLCITPSVSHRLTLSLFLSLSVSLPFACRFRSSKSFHPWNWCKYDNVCIRNDTIINHTFACFKWRANINLQWMCKWATWLRIGAQTLYATTK